MPLTSQKPQGLFGSSATFTPTASSKGPASYDISGIKKGSEMLAGATPYSAKTFSPYQFRSPQASNIGAYGTTSPGMFEDIYNQALGVASRPITAQGKESMRQLSQGFEGGRYGGAAGAELAMKQAQATGGQLEDVSKSLGSQLAQARLGEMETARGRDYEEMQNVRNMQFQAEQDRQKQQAAENYQAAGFSDDQSRYMAQDALTRAQTMMGYGFQYPQLQAQLNQQQEQQWQNLMNMFSSLGGI